MEPSYGELARAALTLQGIAFAEEDLAVLELVALALDPGLRALDEADLGELPLESDLDPSRAPGEA
ncbi:MAG TPA: hypothetical protein VGG08_04615 [Solirubrobacteraceae bacterium]|jgi:hypothetical protein